MKEIKTTSEIETYFTKIILFFCGYILSYSSLLISQLLSFEICYLSFLIF